MVTGVFGALIAAVFQITAKRLRNHRLVRRGEAPVKDVFYQPFWLLFGILGLMAGLGWTWRLEGTWLTGAIAGCGMPALASLCWIGWGLAQLRR